MDETQNFDVVVVGGGLAGSVAGVRAAELGLRVAVLEKGTTPLYPCNTRYSGGVFHIASRNVRLPKDELVAAINHRTFDWADPVLADVLAGQAGSTIDWLTGYGAKFIKGPPTAGDAHMAAPPRPMSEVSNWMTSWERRGPDMLLRLLAQTLEKLGGMLILDARAEVLMMSDRQCVGVEASIAGQRRQFSAEAVVIADGGFQANPDMVRENISPRPDAVKQRNVETGCGDGIRMAHAVGAALTPMNRFYGHIMSRDAMHNPQLWPYPILDGLAIAGIVVDATGMRFADEGNGGVYLANAIAGLPDPLSATVICDTAIWDGPGRAAHPISANPQVIRGGGTIYQADSIAALAAVAGLPAEALAASVEMHNGACRSGSFEALDPPRTISRYAATPIAKAPFYAIPACAGITYTMGGIKIDGDGRVLRGDGGVIEGLYAAGSSTGGLEGGPRGSYVSGLTKAAVFGKQAAEHIARQRGTGN